MFVFMLQYDGAVADFPVHTPASSTVSTSTSSSSSSGSSGSGSRYGGYSSYSEWKWHVLNKPNMDMLRNHQHKGTYKTTSPGKC